MKTGHILLVLLSAGIISCTYRTDLFEKTMAMPEHEWKGTNQPSFSFNITDTSVHYQLYIIFRHDNRYRYNNLWLDLSVLTPDSILHNFNQIELPLATNEKGWLASGMDDIFEHRVALTLDPEKLTFKKAGKYTFRFSQIMREDPLEHVYNVGLRLEKKPL